MLQMNTKRIILFVVFTYAITWLMVLSFFLAGGEWNTPAATIVALASMFIPGLVAIGMQRLHSGQLREALAISLRPNRWFLVAWLLPPVLAVATLGVTLLFPGIQFAPDMTGMFERFAGVLGPDELAEMERQMEGMPFHPFWLVLLQGLIAGITINAVAGFGEELGWRGYLLNETIALGFWRSSLLIGVIWGFWHAPMILLGHNYPQNPVPGVFFMVAFTTLLAPLYSYVRLNARSIIAPSIMHGTMNATGGLSILLIAGGSDLTTGLTGLPGLLVLVALNAGLLLHIRRTGPVELP